MSTPGVWDSHDLEHILGNYGVFALERSGTEIESTLAELKSWAHRIWVIRQVSRDVSHLGIFCLGRRALSLDKANNNGDVTTKSSQGQCRSYPSTIFGLSYHFYRLGLSPGTSPSPSPMASIMIA